MLRGFCRFSVRCSFCLGVLFFGGCLFGWGLLLVLLCVFGFGVVGGCCFVVVFLGGVGLWFVGFC